MLARDYFPLGIATGSAFCNRSTETALLLDNIMHGKHSLLMAPRRYGKSSLAMHAIKKSKLPYVEIDFYMARNEENIANYILKGTAQLIGQAVGPIEKLINTVKNNLKNLQPKLNIETKHVSLELEPAMNADPADQVKEALLLLEKLLAQKKQRAILLLDEFQNIGVIADGVGIEAAIRHVAQKTKYLTMVFSGSNRKLLATMFDDDKRPLYKLCWKLTLERITHEHYIKHVNKASVKKWQQPLAEPVIANILNLVERHPYYVNKLCDLIWAHTDKVPTKEITNKIWKLLLAEEKSDAVKEISNLSPGQKAVLGKVASSENKSMTDAQTLFKLQMSSSSVISALKNLSEKDFIEKQEVGYRLLNPVIKYYALSGGHGVLL